MSSQDQSNQRLIFPLFLLVIVFFVAVIGAFSTGYLQFSSPQQEQAKPKTPQSKAYKPGEAISTEKVGLGKVGLIVDYGDGHRWQHLAIKWKKGMTALDAMEVAKKHPRGLNFKYQGKGEKAFLTEFDSVKNQGGGEDEVNKNWLYFINNKKVDVSFGVYELKPSDVILWKYQTFK